MRAANLLLIGPDAATREYLIPLLPSLVPPVVGIDGANPHFPTAQVGTLIVWNVARLTRSHQDEFLDWLDTQQGSARIIGMSPTSVYPEVRSGAFRGDLYYCLNTVTIVLPRRKHVAVARLGRGIVASRARP